MLYAQLGEMLAQPFRVRTDYWESMDFRAGDIEGHMLMARPGVTPPEVQFAPGLQGYHKIYVAMLALDPKGTYCTMRLSGDSSPTRLTPANPAPDYWRPSEIIEEVL